MKRDDVSKKIILALDLLDFERARYVLDELKSQLQWVKIGSATFYHWGKDILKVLKERHLRIFVDFKFHDIPNTVVAAVESILSWGIQMFTVHLSGGRSMLKATVERVQEVSKKLNVSRPAIIGVSVLTSLDEERLRSDLKIPVRLNDLISNLAILAKESSLDGIVASGHEIELIRSVVGNHLKIVCPGIRAPGDAKADQKRTLTAGEAFRKGADFVVIGRPLYESPRPREVFEEILNEIAHGT